MEAIYDYIAEFHNPKNADHVLARMMVALRDHPRRVDFGASTVGRRSRMNLLFYSDVDDAALWRRCLSDADPSIDVRIWPDLGPRADIEAALVWRPPPGELAALPNLKLVVNLGAGVDHIVQDRSLPEHVPIARIVDPAMSLMMTQFVLLSVLRHHRNFGDFERARSERRWAYILPRPSSERSVGVMGLGHLGSAAAAELVRQGFKVRGWSRTARDLPGVECFHGPVQLKPFLEGCEILVLILPLTPETTGLINRETLACLPVGARLINVGRGSLVNDEALLDALDCGHIAEATLDVFQTEPLPADHPYWSRPQVLVTPHLASIAVPQSAARQVADNLRRLREGLPLLNLVDRSRGY